MSTAVFKFLPIRHVCCHRIVILPLSSRLQCIHNFSTIIIYYIHHISTCSPPPPSPHPHPILTSLSPHPHPTLTPASPHTYPTLTPPSCTLLIHAYLTHSLIPPTPHPHILIRSPDTQLCDGGDPPHGTRGGHREDTGGTQNLQVLPRHLHGSPWQPGPVLQGEASCGMELSTLSCVCPPRSLHQPAASHRGAFVLRKYLMGDALLAVVNTS